MNAPASGSRGFSSGAVLLVALGSFVGGYVVRTPTPAQKSASTISLPDPIPESAIADPAQQAANVAVVAADAAAAAADAAALAEPSAMDPAEAPVPIRLGEMTLVSMTPAQWTAYKIEFFQKNPGLLQLDGLAPLLADEFSSTATSMTADSAMKAAVTRASRRWIEQQTAVPVPDPMPTLSVPTSAPNTAIASEEAETNSEAAPDSGNTTPS